MDEIDVTDYESETFESSEEESETENGEDVLKFCQKITEELRFCFSRNSGNDDYCENIYEDKFKTPESGSHSYYADILAVAQLNEKFEGQPKFAKVVDDSKKNVEDGMSIHPSNWQCSGLWIPSIGIGPFEELFHVLQEHYSGFARPRNNDAALMFYPQEWTTDHILNSPYEEELIASIDTVYPSFIDSFQRWNNDSFAPLSSMDNNNLMSHDYQSSF